MSARILAVDDTPQNLRLLEALLSRDGYEVVTAASGDEALRAIAERPPDLVLLDILMPGMDGYELTRRLRASPSPVPSRERSEARRACWNSSKIRS